MPTRRHYLASRLYGRATKPPGRGAVTRARRHHLADTRPLLGWLHGRDSGTTALLMRAEDALRVLGDASRAQASRREAWCVLGQIAQAILPRCPMTLRRARAQQRSLAEWCETSVGVYALNTEERIWLIQSALLLLAYATSHTSMGSARRVAESALRTIGARCFAPK